MEGSYWQYGRENVRGGNYQVDDNDADSDNEHEGKGINLSLIIKSTLDAHKAHCAKRSE